ncbi:TolC family protein [bacterium]|nr:TolC family protein [bacterium]
MNKKIVLLSALLCLPIQSTQAAVSIERNVDQKIKRNTSQISVIPLPLKGLIREVIRRNATLLYSRMQLKSSGYKVQYEKNIFIPEYSASLNHHDTKTPNNTGETLSRGGLSTQEEDKWSFKTGIGGLIQSGGNWDLEYLQSGTSSSLIDSLRAYETEYESRFKFTFRQPVLKGFGSDIVFSDYNKAKLDEEISRQNYEKTTMDLIAYTIREYWKLNGAQSLADSLSKSVKLLEESEKLLRLKVESGEIAKSELLEAKNTRMSRQVELESIKNNRDKSKFTLLKLLNIDLSSKSNYVFDTSHSHQANEQNIEVSMNDAFLQIRKTLPQFKIAEAKYEKSKIHFKKKRNDSKASLDVVASTWLSNLADGAMDKDAFKDDYVSWKVGLEYKVPLSAQREHNSILMARQSMRQAEAELKYLERSVMLDLKILLNTMKGSKHQLTIMKEVYSIKEKLLEGQFKRFKFGQVSIREVIKKEEEVSLYKRKLVNQFISNKINQVNYDKFMGLIMPRYFPDYQVFSQSVDLVNIPSKIFEKTFQ